MDTVMRQGIMRFADAAARDTALSAVLAEGMMAYLDDTNEVLKYDGTDWIDISGDISGVTAGTALTGGGTSGNVTLDVDETALTIAQSQVTDLTTDLAGKQDDVITTQGDLVIGDASGDPVRLPVGSADQVLTSDGTTVSFQDAGGGGGADWVKIVDEVSISGADNFTVTGLSGYSDYAIALNDVSFASDNRQLQIAQINGVSGGGVTHNTQVEMGQSSSDNIAVNEQFTMFLLKTSSQNSRGEAFINITGAGSSAPARIEYRGGSNNTAQFSTAFIGASMITKNNTALDTIRFESNFDTIDVGTINIWAR